jgi:hypothetical protein
MRILKWLPMAAVAVVVCVQGAAAQTYPARGRIVKEAGIQPE